MSILIFLLIFNSLLATESLTDFSLEPDTVIQFPATPSVIFTGIAMSNNSNFQDFRKMFALWADLMNYTPACDFGLNYTSLWYNGITETCYLGNHSNYSCYNAYVQATTDSIENLYLLSLTNDTAFVKYIFFDLFSDLLRNGDVSQCQITTETCSLFKIIGIMITDVCVCPEDFTFIPKDGIGQLFLYLITTNPHCSCPETRYFTILRPEVVTVNEKLQSQVLSPELFYDFDITENALNFFIRVKEDNFQLAKYTMLRVINEDDYFFVNSTQAVFIYTERIQDEGYMQTSVFLIPNFDKAALVSNKIDKEYEDSFNKPCIFIYGKKVENIEPTKLVGFLQHNFNRTSGPVSIPEQSTVLITDEFPDYLNTSILKLDSMKRHFDVLLVTESNRSTELYAAIDQNFQKILVKDNRSSERLNHVFLVNCDDSQSFLQIPTGQQLLGSVTFAIHSKSSVLWMEIVFPILLALIFILIIVAFLFWRRYRKSLTKQNTRNITTTYDLPPEGAEIFEKARNEVFVDESKLVVDFNTVLGKGAFSTVYSGSIIGPAPMLDRFPSLESRRFMDCRVAVKIGNQIGTDQIEQLIREVDAGRLIGYHPNICSFLAWTLHRGLPTIVFEPIEGGDLLKYSKSFRNSKEEFPERNVIQLFWQISDALRHVASLNLVHRDVAARNVLLAPGPSAKLADFGLCSTCDESFTYRASLHNRLPIRWLPPEALLDRLFSEASDVWSFGVLIWEVYSFGITPFGGIATGNELVDFLKKGGKLEKPKIIPEKIWNLAENCWNLNREQRPTFSQIGQNLRQILEEMTNHYGYLPYDLNEKQNDENYSAIFV